MTAVVVEPVPGGQVPESNPSENLPHYPGFFRRFVRLAGPYWSSEEKWKVRTLTTALALLTVIQVLVPIAVNLWSLRLFDALEQRSMDRFMSLIGVLGAILVANMAITSVHLWVKRRLQLGWRRWLTRHLLEDWMAQGRHFQVNYMPGAHDNPDGRIAEDIRNATEGAIDLAHSLAYCVLLLVSFTQILWILSGTLEINVAGVDLSIPGHMVWVAILYATAGTTAAVLIGLPLVRATDKRQTMEANFRFGLVRARENSEAIALVKGEVDERRRFAGLFMGVRAGFNAQTSALVRIFMFTSGYSVLSTAFPVLVAAPRYIAGTITLGMLMQTAQAFQQMAAALSWPVDNMARVAEWRASVERVLSLHHPLQVLKARAQHGDNGFIQIAPGEGESLIFRQLTISNPHGDILARSFDAEIAPGERVLISGDGVAAVRLFKAVAGLWPWGRGRVELPAEACIFFMPQRPYLPISPLHEALTYPADPWTFEEEELREVLARVGLADLARRLDHTDTWEQVLTVGEQQRLGFARLLLHRPNWIFIEESTDALDPDGEDAMMRLLDEEFPDATVLTVGYHAALDKFHHRKLVLTRGASFETAPAGPPQDEDDLSVTSS